MRASELEYVAFEQRANVTFCQKLGETAITDHNWRRNMVFPLRPTEATIRHLENAIISRQKNPQQDRSKGKFLMYFTPTPSTIELPPKAAYAVQVVRLQYTELSEYSTFQKYGRIFQRIKCIHYCSYFRTGLLRMSSEHVTIRFRRDSNQAPETNKPMILNGPTSRNREGSDQDFDWKNVIFSDEVIVSNSNDSTALVYCMNDHRYASREGRVLGVDVIRWGRTSGTHLRSVYGRSVRTHFAK
ncbi:hypothetical protein ANN_15519 [Periplaneta americana]|uniref:Uncharacterized protein n=1 Tax=Periplaneta americana TaxID=6978 RepID=A0ABQ8SIH8_PERAM|nr:hypothetical protein ANN_15519 [Periplaneta americana]